MANLLIFAQDHGSYRKGDILEAREDGRARSPAEGLPLFIWVEIPGLDPGTIQNRTRVWRYDIDYEVVGVDASIDGARLRLWNATQSVSGAAKIARQRVEEFILRWNASIHSVDADAGEVRIDLTVMDMVRSPAFWRRSVPAARIAEQAYDQATGIHRVAIDYAGTSIEPAMVAGLIERRGGTIISNANLVCTFDIHRSDLLPEFKADLNSLAEPVQARRYYLAPGAVDAVVSAGGVVQRTAAEVSPYIRDRVAE